MFKITRNLGTIKSMASSQNQTSTNTNPAGIGQINLSNREIEKGFRAFFFVPNHAMGSRFMRVYYREEE